MIYVRTLYTHAHLLSQYCYNKYCIFCRLDREKEYREIFGDSSDSESNFEDFVAQNKSNKRRRPSGNLSDDSYSDTPQPRKKRAGVKLKQKATKNVKKKQPQKRQNSTKTDENFPEQTTILDKENLDKIEKAIKQAHVPKTKYKKRTEEAEEALLNQYINTGPSKEEVQMFKLALVRLLAEGEEIVKEVRWAYYPDNILCVWSVCVCVCVEYGVCLCVCVWSVECVCVFIGLRRMFPSCFKSTIVTHTLCCFPYLFVCIVLISLFFLTLLHLRALRNEILLSERSVAPFPWSRLIM